MGKRKFGNITTLPSGKFRARYTGPDGDVHKAPKTFFEKDDAIKWLRDEQKLIEFDEWTAPSVRNRTQEDNRRTVGEWLQEWLDIRSRGTQPLKKSSQQTYQTELDNRILKVGGKASRLRDVKLVTCTRRDISDWWDAINEQFETPTHNQLAYGKVVSAMRAAVDRDLIPVSPATVRAASKTVSRKRKQLPEDEVMWSIVDQLDKSVDRIDGKYKLAAILTLFHGLRIGEVLGLKRKHIIATNTGMTVTVRGNVYRIIGEGMVWQDTPKSDAGDRDVPILGVFHDDVRWHLKTFVGDSIEAFLFPGATGKPVTDSTYRRVLKRAKDRAGVADVKLSSHYGRVWLITALAELGYSPAAIGSILGQEDLRTITEVYMRVSPEYRLSAMCGVNDRIRK